jgi:hypothetical protein
MLISGYCALTVAQILIACCEAIPFSRMVSKRLNTVFQNFKHNIKLRGVTRAYFNKSEWERNDIADKVSWKYLLYRGAYCAYFIICLIINIAKSDHPNLYLIYATNWSFIVQTFYGLVYFSNIAHRFVQFRRYESKRTGETTDSESGTRPARPRPITELNVFDSISWLLVNVTGTIPYIVTAGFWAFIYPRKEYRGAGYIILYLTSHGFNAVLALVDTFVNAIPIRVAHCLYTVALTLVYILFSLFYELAGGAYAKEEEPFIYYFLNWHDKPGATVLNCFIALFAAAMLHIALWFLFRFRTHLVLRFNVKGPSNLYIVAT